MDVDNSELDKFNAVLRKVLSVPREELVKREEAWQREQARKKALRSDAPRKGAE